MASGDPPSRKINAHPWVWARLADAYHQDPEGTEAGEAGSRPIGEAAVQRGWITEQQLQEALREQQARSGEGWELLGQVLVRRRWLTASQLAELLTAQPVPESTTVLGGGERLGKYELRAVLGQGGMGVVFRAYDTVLHREVALKLLDRPAAADRLQREARAAARLKHPNIVTLYEMGQHKRTTYLAMEMIEGETLGDAWSGWPLRRKVAVVERVARAVAYAHEKGVVHRDLKPGNVMVTAQGEAKVMDLGLARVEGETRVTVTGAVMGTPAYMAPEQVRGESAGPAADVYSLGVILYEALTGAVPFEGRTAQEVYERVLKQEPVPPRKINPRVGKEIEVVCLKAMEKEAARRYAGAGELADDLKRWLKGEPISAKPAGGMYRLYRRIRKNPWPWAAAGVGIVGALVVVVVWGWMAAAGGRQEEANRAVQAAEVAYREGNVEECRRQAQQALDLAPGHALGRYWLARLKLREYQARRPLPQVRIADGSVDVMPPKAETAEQRRLRDEIEAAFRGVPGSALAEGVLALWDGRYEEARAKLGAVRQEEKGTAAAWEAGLLEAWALFLVQRFDEAQERLTPYLMLDAGIVGPLRGQILLARGMEAQLTGQDVGVWFEAAEAVGDQLVEAGHEAEGRVLRATAEVEWGKAWLDLGREPEQRYERALGWLEGLEGAQAEVARGDALLARAKYLAERGRVSPADPKEFEEAIAAYTRAIDADSRYGTAYVKRAGAYVDRRLWYMELGFGQDPAVDSDLERARDDYARARELEPAYLGAEIGLARVEGALKRASKLDPGPTLAAYEEEIGRLTAAVERHPEYAPGYLVRGTVRHEFMGYLVSVGQDPGAVYEAACRDFTRALEINPRYTQALQRRAACHMFLTQWLMQNRGDIREAISNAIRDLTDALEINCNFARALVDRGTARGRLGYFLFINEEDPAAEFAASLEDLGRALVLNPLSPRAFVARGKAFYIQGEQVLQSGGDPTDKFEASIRDCTAALNLSPVLIAALVDRAKVRTSLAAYKEDRGQDPAGVFDAASEDLRRVREIGPSGFESWFSLGQAECTLAIRRRDRALLEEALQSLDRAVELNPHSGAGLLARGRALLQLGRRAEAVADFERALELAPGQRREIERLLRRARGEPPEE